MLLVGGALTLSAGVVSATASQSTPTAARGLVAKLAVLRRPQVASDVLPAGLGIKRQQGTIIGRLTRLIAVEPGARLFLVVSTPVRGNPPLWRPALGDQVAVVAVTTHGASESQAVPAVDLTDAGQVGYVGATTGKGPAYRVAVVPDGVARVRWTLGNFEGKVLHHVAVGVADNAAVAPVRPIGLVLRGRWYAADGARIPTSGQALRHAIAADDAVRTQRLLRYDSRHVHHAAPALLDDFAVFAVSSRTGVTTPAGLTISHPRPSQVPLGILQIASARTPLRIASGSGRLQPDLGQIRAVRARSGLEFWVIPGARDLCVAVLDQSPLPIEIGGSGSAESCTRDVTSANIAGEGLSSGGPGGTTITYGILPKAHPTTTIRTGPHARRTIRPPDGVYITRYVPRVISRG